MVLPNNPYLDEVINNLPRLLSLFDTDQSSESYGMGDRYFWAWGLIDFANGTFQGAAHGLARIWSAGLWPYTTSQETFLKRINSIFSATQTLTKTDGSLEEAFPNEGSYCVTALVAFDLLCTLDLLANHITPEESIHWRKCIEPMINYLIKSDETHALISNHLATAVAALARWHKLTGDVKSEQKGKYLLERIIKNQSEEGWFTEYEGADPGYETLGIYYLADVHNIKPEWNLLEILSKSINFLKHFAHPDGSFGGLYGSRCTRFYCPAGILSLSKKIPDAAALAKFMENSIAKRHTITLSAIDEPNLVPLFNAYCWAAVQKHKADTTNSSGTVPALTKSIFQAWYPKAGLLIDSGKDHYSIVSTHKGGVVYHFCSNSKNNLINGGILLQRKNGKYGSTQSYNPSNTIELNKSTLSVTARITSMPKQLTNPWSFLIIRIMSMTIFRSTWMREWVKRKIVRLLITNVKPWKVQNQRVIHLGENLKIQDYSTNLGGENLVDVNYFVPIHMASQGYWQAQDEMTNDTKI